MFDYQAGEKYKLTLIMVALAGFLAGMFFTVLLMPTPEATPRARQKPKWANNPDATGGMTSPGPGGMPAAGPGGQGPPPGQGMPGQAAPMAADPYQARELLETKFLPLVWDLSAYSARASQGKAIAYMTEDCKRAYMSNIWTTAIASQIEQSGMQSQFTPKKIEPSPIRQDGSVEVTVEGLQTLSVPGKGEKIRQIKVVYLVKQYPDGLKIAGISEAGQGPTQ
jgi:hypothetical protein